MSDPVNEYINVCRKSLQDPNSTFSIEARAAGKHFLDCWDAWKKEADKHKGWMSSPTWIMIFLFPYYLYWTYKWDKRCDSLYKKLNEAQDRFNELTLAYRKSNG